MDLSLQRKVKQGLMGRVISLIRYSCVSAQLVPGMRNGSFLTREETSLYTHSKQTVGGQNSYMEDGSEEMRIRSHSPKGNHPLKEEK